MSEVIGYLLVFGILALVLVLSMSAFSVAQGGARDRVVQLRAESAAARVAGVVVETAILWEQQHTATTDVVVAYTIDLPDQLEGLDYVVRLENAGDLSPCAAGGPASAEQVCVHVPALNLYGTAPIFSAAAPPQLFICSTQVTGGTLAVRINAPADGSNPAPASCNLPNRLFLEVA